MTGQNQFILYLNTAKEFHHNIEKLTNPAKIWCKLKQHFYPDNRAHQMMLCSELFSCKIKLGKKVNMFAARITRIAELLEAIDQPMKEIYLSLQLMRYLPEKFVIE